MSCWRNVSSDGEAVIVGGRMKDAQLPTQADSVGPPITLLAFARRTRLLLSAGRAAIVVLQVCCCEPVLGLTDRRTPYHCIDPAAPYTVRTVPIIEVSLHARLRSRQSPGYATDTYEVSLVRLLASSGDCTVVRLCRRDVFRTIRQGALLTSTMHSIIQIRQSLTCEH